MPKGNSEWNQGTRQTQVLVAGVRQFPCYQDREGTRFLRTYQRITSIRYWSVPGRGVFEVGARMYLEGRSRVPSNVM
jgi:hypothetical protein